MGREAAGVRSSDPRIRRFVAEYLSRRQQSYEPELVLAFGSRARGDALEDSDLDLIVVSACFRGVPFLDRITQVSTDLDVPFAVDLLCYTPEESAAKRDEIGTVSAALEEGLVLSTLSR
jgi:predicted nucleotidyltransferase